MQPEKSTQFFERYNLSALPQRMQWRKGKQILLSLEILFFVRCGKLPLQKIAQSSDWTGLNGKDPHSRFSKHNLTHLGPTIVQLSDCRGVAKVSLQVGSKVVGSR